MTERVTLHSVRRLNAEEIRFLDILASQSRIVISLIQSGDIVENDLTVISGVLFMDIGGQYITVNSDGDVGMSHQPHLESINESVVFFVHMEQLHRRLTSLLS